LLKHVPKPIHILIVEDNAGDARLIKEALNDGNILHSSHSVKDGVQAMNFLSNNREFTKVPCPYIRP